MKRYTESETLMPCFFIIEFLESIVQELIDEFGKKNSIIP